MSPRRAQINAHHRRLAAQLRRIARDAQTLADSDPDDVVARLAELHAAAGAAVDEAVVYRRLVGDTWRQLGEQLGGRDQRNMAKKYGPAVRAVDNEEH